MKKFQKILEEILSSAGLEFTGIDAEEKDGTVWLDVRTDEPSHIIGRQGETLNAIQHLFRVLLWRNDISGFSVIDVENYKKNQQENAVSAGLRAAKTVAETGAPEKLPEMAPDKRRAVHLAIIADFPDLETKSVGTGRFKQIVISKKDA